MSISIAAKLAFDVGKQIQVWISKNDISTDIKLDDLLCPEDMLCIAEQCQGQKEGKEIGGITPICTNVSPNCKTLIARHEAYQYLDPHVRLHMHFRDLPTRLPSRQGLHGRPILLTRRPDRASGQPDV